ncbi:MAG: imidazolonepropionase [Bacteroidetes bacterium]|nr:imidazolonepropionase [Bacteroidia bacterium]PCH68567.1 MAG: imidazolonepropionase [Bacteroidota bacterium]
MKILIQNIKGLIQYSDSKRGIIKGNDMGNLPVLEDSFLIINDDKIDSFGSMTELTEDTETFDQVVDVAGKFVFPCWCDSHTHIVYAGSRELEFVDRINGLSYEEIANNGGGILNSAKKLQNTSEDELIESALSRLNEVARTGTGAIEIKSGYGLTVDAELKMLRVIKKLKDQSPLTIKATFLGAHAVPQEYKEDRAGYINLIINEMLPIVKDEQLADYIDVFCETGYFTPEETEKIIQVGADTGLKAKIHVNQFTSIGGIETCVKNSALSVDHLEVMEDSDIDCLRGSNTIPVLLPSCSFFLKIPYGPARKLIEADLPVTLATDFNPGSTPSGNIPFVVSLACIKMNMTPEEAINAATLNGAYAMEVDDELGSIEVGKKANLFITKEIPSYSYLPYAFGSSLIETVFINGKKV